MRKINNILLGSLSLLFVCLVGISYSMSPGIIGGLMTSGNPCGVHSAEISQVDDDTATLASSLTGGCRGQSITVSTEFTLYSIIVKRNAYNDGGEFKLRYGTSADLTTPTEEITATFPYSDARSDIEFVSVINPTITTGTWYFAVRITEPGKSASFRVGEPNPYAGGTYRQSFENGSWNLLVTDGDWDLYFIINKCGN